MLLTRPGWTSSMSVADGDPRFRIAREAETVTALACRYSANFPQA
jgi:hypothetical protein